MLGQKGTNFHGQHLIVNKRLIRDIIQFARIGPNETVVEIGAGKGALTLPLAERAGRLIAYEYDLRLVRLLQSRLAGRRGVKILAKDFLKCELPQEPYCVVANIPFSITTPILGKLLDQLASGFERAVLVVEKGAAIRFTSRTIADPRILMWRIGFEFEMVRTIPPGDFSPPPRVECAVLSIRRRAVPLIHPRAQARFMELATYGLRNPKLAISEALRGVFSHGQLKKLSRLLKLERRTPIWTLNEQDWATIFQCLAQK